MLSLQSCASLDHVGYSCKAALSLHQVYEENLQGEKGGGGGGGGGGGEERHEKEISNRKRKK